MMDAQAKIYVALIALAAAVLGAVIAQIGGWTSQSRARGMATGRIVALLREQRYFTDRAKNEVDYQHELGLYQYPWQRSIESLRNRLDAGDHSLSGAQILAAYTACFRAQEAVFADRRGFAKELLQERVANALAYVKRAQEIIGDAAPEAYYKNDPR